MGKGEVGLQNWTIQRLDDTVRHSDYFFSPSHAALSG